MELQNFCFNDTAVRVLADEQGEPWFVAKDVCDVLGLYPGYSLRYLDDDEKSKLSRKQLGMKSGQSMFIINESGLYSLVMKSRKPQAKAFKKWVTNGTVLLSTRKYGGYIVGLKYLTKIKRAGSIILVYKSFCNCLKN